MEFKYNLLKFEDIRKAIVEYLKEKSEYVDFDFEASNISFFIDSLAYTIMLMNYNLSHVTNNLFLDTADIRKNIVSIAKNIGYRPKRRISSKIGVKFLYIPSLNLTQEDILIIPQGTKFLGQDTKSIFYNKTDILLTFNNETGNFESKLEYLYEGEIKEIIYYGNGKKYQSFVIPDETIEENSLKIVSKIGDIEYIWEEGNIFNGFNLNSNIYFLEEDIFSGNLKICFGDNLISKIPNKNEVFRITYISSKGSLGNNENSIEILNNQNLNFNIQNLKIEIVYPSFGGKDKETDEEIKFNAPKYFSSFEKAITKEDIKFLIKNNFGDIIDDFIIEEGWKLFDDRYLGISFISGAPKLNLYDLFKNKKLFLEELVENKILDFLDRFSPISTKRIFLKPTYIYIDITPTIEFNKNISLIEKQTVLSNLMQRLKNFYINEYSSFNINFREEKIKSILNEEKAILSSFLDIKSYLVFNNDFFYSNKDNILYLPKNIEIINGIKNERSFLDENKDIQKPEESSFYGKLKDGKELYLDNKTNILKIKKDKYFSKKTINKNYNLIECFLEFENENNESNITDFNLSLDESNLIIDLNNLISKEFFSLEFKEDEIDIAINNLLKIEFFDENENIIFPNDILLVDEEDGIRKFVEINKNNNDEIFFEISPLKKIIIFNSNNIKKIKIYNFLKNSYENILELFNLKTLKNKDYSINFKEFYDKYNDFETGVNYLKILRLKKYFFEDDFLFFNLDYFQNENLEANIDFLDDFCIFNGFKNGIGLNVFKTLIQKDEFGKIKEIDLDILYDDNFEVLKISAKKFLCRIKYTFNYDLNLPEFTILDSINNLSEGNKGIINGYYRYNLKYGNNEILQICPIPINSTLENTEFFITILNNNILLNNLSAIMINFNNSNIKKFPEQNYFEIYYNAIGDGSDIGLYNKTKNEIRFINFIEYYIDYLINRKEKNNIKIFFDKIGYNNDFDLITLRPRISSDESLNFDSFFNIKTILNFRNINFL